LALKIKLSLKEGQTNDFLSDFVEHKNGDLVAKKHQKMCWLRVAFLFISILVGKWQK
jgi:hypothetical protein